ncbi:hypothetical protein KBX50_08465 [Micromonospora sp. C51]|uniref:hypothetical protein n=1 Tax=Micromonospora sp. C51 TaxID=2824879 RepID=UPI001B39B08E|nr:hypothetical protein [Micromonospora sp. C51]MBQ1048496.1 hypothetical protein [Micromonospora sp. C51]
MPHSLQVFSMRQAFLPYTVTEAAGLPQHIAHADVLIVVALKDHAAAVAERVGLDLGPRLQRIKRADVRDKRALVRLNLINVPRLLAHPDLDQYADGHLVSVRSTGWVWQVCTLAQFRQARETLRVSSPY